MLVSAWVRQMVGKHAGSAACCCTCHGPPLALMMTEAGRCTCCCCRQQELPSRLHAGRSTHVDLLQAASCL